jgi:hypothetical protein
MVVILAPDRFLLVTPAACLLLLVQPSALTALIQLPFLLATVLSAAAAVVILTLHGLRLQVYRSIQGSEYRGKPCAWPWMKNLYSNAFLLLAIPSYTQLSLSAKRQLPWVDCTYEPPFSSLSSSSISHLSTSRTTSRYIYCMIDTIMTLGVSTLPQ